MKLGALFVADLFAFFPKERHLKTKKPNNRFQVWEKCLKAVAGTEATRNPWNITKVNNEHFPTYSSTQLRLEMYFHGELVSQMKKNYFFTLQK